MAKAPIEDVMEFIAENELGVDNDVALLFSDKAPQKLSRKQKKAQAAAAVSAEAVEEDKEAEQDDDEEMTHEELLELEAYLELEKDPKTEVKIKVYANKTQAINERVQDIKLEGDWIDTQHITSPLAECDPSDDLQRELAIYNQAMHSVSEAKKMLKSMNVPIERPADYFAEMVKSDEQMMRIRKRLLSEKDGMDKSEAAKKQRLLKKFGKKVQVEKLQHRAQEKTKNMEKIKHFKQDQNEEFDITTTGSSKKDKERNHKREGKNSKYGFGGSKRQLKTNTHESTNEMGGFSIKKMKGVPRGSKGGVPKGGSKTGGRGSKGGVSKKRPGKSSRAKN